MEGTTDLVHLGNTGMFKMFRMPEMGCLCLKSLPTLILQSLVSKYLPFSVNVNATEYDACADIRK